MGGGTAAAALAVCLSHHRRVPRSVRTRRRRLYTADPQGESDLRKDRAPVQELAHRVRDLLRDAPDTKLDNPRLWRAYTRSVRNGCRQCSGRVRRSRSVSSALGGTITSRTHCSRAVAPGIRACPYSRIETPGSKSPGKPSMTIPRTEYHRGKRSHRRDWHPSCSPNRTHR